MTRWEYLRVDVCGHGMTNEELDEHGRQGWELVLVYKPPLAHHEQLVFKRPLVEALRAAL